uniref:Purine nucleoside phosphorylase n=1 Tax=Hemiselmis andersenii TaxID=464988 RepID=A0A6U4K4K9_HEMAN|mmetsp:Transcript_9056/g.21104  ORF Transcript_9056/g.21104 Transcript_9056/m.21104 type:complete len:285 (+) Transcript_9056:54-908(+)
MSGNRSIAQDAADKIKELAPGFTPRIAMTLGSGCGDVANAIENPIVIDYKDIPGFPVSTVQGHAGQLLLGTLAGIPIAGLKGRVHYYEGNPRAMVIPVYAMRLIGAEFMFITNAAGSLRQEMGPGALVALTDHMNFSGVNPIVGHNDVIGPRFPSMYNGYDKELRDMLLAIAEESKIKMHQGVYVGTSGPSFETAAEINGYRILGGDTVGMSTVGEVILCRHCGLRVCAISIVVNYAAGMTDDHITHEETLHYTKLAAESVATLVKAWVAKVQALPSDGKKDGH